MNKEEKFKIAIKFFKKIPSECNPRIGGSCALWRKGFRDDFNDVDIIVDYLPFPDWHRNASTLIKKVPVKHEKRLNHSFEYEYNGVHFDIHESLMPRRNNDMFEDVENILYSQKILKKFIKIVYDEDVEKWSGAEDKHVEKYVPKDGDFIVIEDNYCINDTNYSYKWICIFKSFDDKNINFYVGLKGTDEWLLNQGNPSYINRTFNEVIRPADFGEKCKLEFALEESGKVWDKVNKIVENIKTI